MDAGSAPWETCRRHKWESITKAEDSPLESAISPITFIESRKSLFLNTFCAVAGFKISAKSLIPLIFVYILN